MQKRGVYWLFGFFIVVLISTTHFLFVKETLYSQDEYGIINSAKNILSHGKLLIDNGLEINTNILYQDFTTYKAPYEVYYSGFPYTSFFYAFLLSLFGDDLYFFWMITSIWVLSVGFILSRLFNSTARSYIYVFLILFIPSIFYFRLSYYNNFLITGLILLSLFFYYKLKKTNHTTFFYLFLLMLGIITLFRLPEGIFVFLSFLIYFLFTKQYKLIFKVLIIYCLFCINLLIVNKYYYGDFLYISFLKPYDYLSNIYISANGQGSQNRNFFISAISYLLGSEYGLKGFDILRVFKMYFVQHLPLLLNNKFWLPVYSVFFFLGLLKFRNKLKLFLPFLIIIIFITYFYGNRGSYFGFGEYKITSSYFRYNMFVYCFLLLIILNIINIFIKNKVLLLFFVFSFFISIFTESISWISYYNIDKNNISTVSNKIINYVSGKQNIIFISGPSTSKYLYKIDKGYFSRNIKDLSLTKLVANNTTVEQKEIIKKNIIKFIKENDKYVYLYLYPVYDNAYKQIETSFMFNNFNYNILQKYYLTGENGPSLDLYQIKTIDI